MAVITVSVILSLLFSSITLVEPLYSAGSFFSCPTFNDGWVDVSESAAPDPQGACINGTHRLKLFRGQKVHVRFRPNDPYGIVTVEISACQDENQSDCYVADISGFSSGRLGYSWSKQSMEEVEEEEEGWLPSTTLQQNLRVEQRTFPYEGKTTYEIYVQRTENGRFGIRIVGGESQQQKEMSFALPDEYSWISVESVFEDDELDIEGHPGCSISTYWTIRFEAGQEMRLNWLTGTNEDSLGLSLCSDSDQSDCFVLELFGTTNQNIHFSWRHHSINRVGNMFWIPGTEEEVPGVTLNQSESNGRDTSTEELIIKLRRTFEGQLIVEVEDGHQKYKSLLLDLPLDYQFGVIDTKNASGRTSYGVLGPCFNGEVFSYLGEPCLYPINISSIQESGNPPHLWFLQPGRSSGEFKIPAAGNGSHVCISASAVVKNGAVLTLSLAVPGGNPLNSIHVGQIEDDGLDSSEFQRVRFLAYLPPELRKSQLNLVVKGERLPGSLLMLQSLEFCDDEESDLPGQK